MGEISFLAIVTIFIAYKLFSILGRVNDEDKNRNSNRRASDCYGSCVYDDDYTNRQQHIKPIKAIVIPTSEAGYTDEIQKKFNEIRFMDPSFEFGKFLLGAEKAYRIVVNAGFVGDQETLSNLTNERVMNSLLRSVDESKKLDHRIVYDLKAVKKLELLNLSVNGKLVTISLKIYSERILCTLAKDGEIISGSKDPIDTTENWTFSRHMSLNNNIWQVVKIA